MQDRVSELENQLKYLRVELKDQYAEYGALLDSNLEIQASLTGEKISRLGLIGCLSGKYKTVEDARADLVTKDLSEQEAIFNDSFDVKKASLKLNDGLDHAPSGETVPNPDQSDPKPNSKFLDGLNKTQLAIIKNIRKFNDNGQQEKAKGLYDKMVSMRVLDPKGLTYDKITSAEALENIPAE
jgi:hypothetical protein